jgi:DNA-binding beta-propeller fold protein YncE
MTTLRKYLPNAAVRVSAVAALVLSIVELAPWMASQDRARLQRPVMMDSNGPGTDLFVLDESGTLHKFHVTQNSLQEYGRATLPAEFTPADMAFAAAEGQDSLLIAGTEAGHGALVRYSVDGVALHTWAFRNICSGIDFSMARHTAYVATSDSNEVYRVDLTKPQPVFVTRISEATKLGPVALDESHQQLFVADVANGKIYEYSFTTKTSKALATGLSAPTALAFDAESNRLFVADPGRGGVFTVDTSAATPAPIEFAPGTLKSPYGITLISGNRVAVADYSANHAVVLSGKGDALFRFPPTD